MAHQYFSPRSSRAETAYQDADNELVGDLEQSIFIFPNPGSGPSSPLSIPTDVSFPSTMASTPTRGRRSSSIGGGNASGSEWDAISRRSVSTDTSLRSPIVEVWEMSDEGDEAAALEEAVERVGRSGALRRPLHQRRYPLGRQPFPPAFTYVDGRFQFRGQREVSVSPIDGQDSFPVVKKAASLPRTSAPPQVAYRLPVLSFLSTLFALDDSTLHLITRPSHPHSSPLFPGARLHPTGESVDSDNTLNEKQQLFHSPELLSLKAGVEVAMDSSITPDSLFALPSLSFACIWNLVSGIYTAPKKIRVGIRAQT